jgi:hypothetical protein
MLVSVTRLNGTILLRNLQVMTNLHSKVLVTSPKMILKPKIDYRLEKMKSISMK